MEMDPTFYRELIARHGPRAAAWHAALRAANLITRLMIFRGLVVTMQTVNKGLLNQPAGRFLKTPELKRFAQNPENDLTEDFLDAATRRGDQCYGFIEGDVLSSYGWYAMYSPANVGTTVVHFSSSYAFRYRGFTHPHFWADNLSAIGMAKALESLSRDGKKGLISHVRFDDFDTLEERLRVGYLHFGHALLLGVGDRLLAHATRGCRTYRFRVGAESAAPAGIRVGERGAMDLDPRTS